MKVLVIGAGYSGSRIARNAAVFAQVVGTRRSESACAELASRGVDALVFNGVPSEELRSALQTTSHLVICVAPDSVRLSDSSMPSGPAETKVLAEATILAEPLLDPVLDTLGPILNQGMPALQWIGYLSTIGVYGDHQGAWVNEESPCLSTQRRSRMRLDTEHVWQQLGHTLHVPVAIMRLSGIYGPGRNALLKAAAGRSRILIKPSQVFNRIHVDDLAVAVVEAMRLQFNGVVNITDDLPAPPQDVIRYAHEMMETEPPQPVDFETVADDPLQLSIAAALFYSENKRVSNARSRELLGMEYRYPNYRIGLQALLVTLSSSITE